MKKKHKKKIANLGEKTFKFVIKLCFVYPIQFIWFAIKSSYQAISEEINKALKKRAANKEVVERNQLKEIARENKTSKNKKKKSKGHSSIPEYDALKELKNQKGKLSSFETRLYKNKSTIGIILGARGTGKSAIGMRLLENFMVNTDKQIYALGFKQSSLPKWVKVIKDIKEIENNSIILLDESGIEFSSRTSMSSANKLLSELLLISRHKDLTVLFIAQNSSNLEINAIRQADYLIMKPSSLLQKDFERKKIKEIYSKIEDDFCELEDPGLTYIYADNYCGFVSNSLPSFWSDKVSKGYSHR
jgi:hypothetical protein